MEVAPRYKLLTLLTMLTWFTLLALLTLFTLHTLHTLFIRAHREIKNQNKDSHTWIFIGN